MAQQSSVKQPEYDITKVFKEIHGDSDRAAAITAATYFEEILVVQLRHLSPMTFESKQ